MVVMIFETVPVSLRGMLSRWMVEPSRNVFVGHISALVRDQLWEKCYSKLKGGGLVQVWSTNNEQHYKMRTFGETRRMIIDDEGLQLVMIPSLKEKK